MSYTEQVALLQSRGMSVPDIPRAERLLANISYYRLSAYMLPYKKKENGTIIDSFKEGTTWDMVYDTCTCLTGSCACSYSMPLNGWK